MKVGFIGLGIMGKPMSKNLIKAGHELVVCDFNKDAVKELTDLGAVSASCGAEVAQQCDVIITMLPNSPHVRTVALGEGGIIEGAKEGTVLIDMSSIDPTQNWQRKVWTCWTLRYPAESRKQSTERSPLWLAERKKHLTNIMI